MSQTRVPDRPCHPDESFGKAGKAAGSPDESQAAARHQAFALTVGGTTRLGGLVRPSNGLVSSGGTPRAPQRGPPSDPRRTLALQRESEFDEELGRGCEVVNRDTDVLRPWDSHLFDGGEPDSGPAGVISVLWGLIYVRRLRRQAEIPPTCASVLSPARPSQTR